MPDDLQEVQEAQFPTHKGSGRPSVAAPCPGRGHTYFLEATPTGYLISECTRAKFQATPTEGPVSKSEKKYKVLKERQVSQQRVTHKQLQKSKQRLRSIRYSQRNVLVGDDSATCNTLLTMVRNPIPTPRACPCPFPRHARGSRDPLPCRVITVLHGHISSRDYPPIMMRNMDTKARQKVPKFSGDTSA